MRDVVFDLSLLEYFFESNLNPGALFIIPTYYNDFVLLHVILESKRFNNLAVKERVGLVFSLLDRMCPDILKNYCVVVEAFTSDEMADAIELYGKT